MFGQWAVQAKRVKTLPGGVGCNKPGGASLLVVDRALFQEVSIAGEGDCVYLAVARGLLVAQGLQLAVETVRQHISDELLDPKRKGLYGWSLASQSTYVGMAQEMRKLGVWDLDLNKQVLPAAANVFQVTFVVWGVVSLDTSKLTLMRTFGPVGHSPATVSHIMLGHEGTFVHLLSSPSHYDLLVYKPTDMAVPGPCIGTSAPAGSAAVGSVSQQALVNSSALMNHIHLNSVPTEEELQQASVAPYSRVQCLRTGLERIANAKTFLAHATAANGNPKGYGPAKKEAGVKVENLDNEGALRLHRASVRCCGKRCIPNLISFEAHWAALKSKAEIGVVQTHNQRIQELSRMAWRDECQRALVYVFEGNEICRAAYSNVHGIPPRSLRRYVNKIRKGEKTSRRVASSALNGRPSLRSHQLVHQSLTEKERTIQAWLKETLPRLTEFNPTKAHMAIQLETYESLFSRFETFCETVNLPQQKRGSAKDLNRVLRREPWRTLMTTRFNPDVGICTICRTLTDQITKADPNLNKPGYQKLIADKTRHRAEWETRRQLVAELALRGATMTDLAVIQTDGADSSKTMCPSLACHTKMEDVQSVTVKLQGVDLQGVGLWVFAIPEYLKTGANVLCTCLLLGFQKAADILPSRFQTMPRKLILEVDGGSENWNTTTLRFLCLCVHAGVYDDMQMCRCPPGHGHNRLDGTYGFLSQCMHGKKRGAEKSSGTDVFTLSQFKRVAMECLEGSKIVDMVDVDFAWDFGTYLDSAILPDMIGHGANQQGDFTFGANVTWWKVTGCTESGPAGPNRRVFIQHKLGYLDSAEEGWLPKDNFNKGFEVTGFDELTAKPAYDRFDERKLELLRGIRREKILKQFRTSVGEGTDRVSTFNVMSQHAMDHPETFVEWEAYFNALPESPDVTSHIRNNASLMIPEFRLPTYERDGLNSETESRGPAVNHVLSLQDTLMEDFALDPVCHSKAEVQERAQALRENTKRLDDRRELGNLQIEVVTQRSGVVLTNGDLVVLAVVDQNLPYMVAKVADAKPRTDGNFQIQWYAATLVGGKAGNISSSKDALLASFTDVVFKPHTQRDWVPRSSVMLCNPTLTNTGKLGRRKQRGERSTVQEMEFLVEKEILCE